MNLQVIIFLVLPVMGKIPDGYIMKLTYQCGKNTTSAASVDIVTDLHAAVTAQCAGDKIVNFTTSDNVNFRLPVSYPGTSNPADCIFVKRIGVDVYTIKVTFSFGEPDNEVHNDLEVRSLTCTFDENGQQISDFNNVSSRLIAPNEIQANAGKKTDSVLTLTLCTIRGHALTMETINLGRMVRLDGMTNGASGEKGVRITQCDAVGEESGTRYQILRAGCGDGVVLKQDEGFITTGLSATSPFFRMFKLGSDKLITFECNFTLCQENCDGSSCPGYRAKRRVDGDLLRTVFTDNITQVSDVKLFLTTEGGIALRTTKLNPRRSYRLMIESNGSSGEKGLRVKSCLYISRKRTREPYSGTLIRHGCGQTVLRETAGFDSKGLKAFSDQFPGFHFRGDNHLSFLCTVKLCMENCDGPSCSKVGSERHTTWEFDTSKGDDILFSSLVRTVPVRLSEIGLGNLKI